MMSSLLIFYKTNVSTNDPSGIYLPIVLYSDATLLTRFNQRSFHPVNVRLAGIPGDLRNTYQHGGITLIGNLPIVSFLSHSVDMCLELFEQIDAPEEEKTRTEFKDFKRRVHHKAMKAILESMQIYSLDGIATKCGDGVTRVLYPGVYCMSMDFEEQ